MVRTKIWQWCPYHILMSSVIYFWADHRNMESICFIWWKSKTLSEAKMWKNTTPFMTQTNNYAHAIMKQKKTKTDYLSGLSVFVFIVNRLGPFEKPFHKLKLRVSSGFPNTPKQLKDSAFGLVLSSVFSCLETLMKHSSSFMKHFILPAIKSLHIERECFRKPQSFCYHFFKFLIHITWIVKRRRRYVSGLVRLKEVNTSLIYPRNKILSNPLNRDFEQSLNVVKPNPKQSLRPRKNITRKISQGNEHSV